MMLMDTAHLRRLARAQAPRMRWPTFSRRTGCARTVRRECLAKIIPFSETRRLADAKVLILDRDPGVLEGCPEDARGCRREGGTATCAEPEPQCLRERSSARLRRTLESFVDHYHHERNHQRLKNRLIEPTATANGTNQIVRQTRLGEILSCYSREAA